MGDFVCTSGNDGTTLFRPVSARGHTFWQEQNFNKLVIDNNEDFYIVKSHYFISYLIVKYKLIII